MDFQKLNSEQKRAVKTIDGRVLVLAGAGSGKTSVLTTRIAYLMSLGVPPEAILGLTFTNKAAAEMRERIGSKGEGLTLCTFHSFCMQILRCHIERLGYTKDFTLYDERDVERLVKSLADGDDLEVAMRAHNAVDFDHLLSLTVKLFEEHPDVLAAYQTRYKYVMIDEYQDTNAVQFRLTELLCQEHNNLCVVGDDDQSIYGWRGADVGNILSFDNATTIRLEQNYRSTNTILNAANAIIANNSNRHAKRLFSENGAGELIKITHAKDETEEAERAVWQIDELRKAHGLRWSDFAILYRSNAISRPFEQALMRYTWQRHGEYVRGIPYTVHGGQAFYDRREVKDIVAYLRVIINPRDEAAILRTINLPRRGVGAVTLDRLTAEARKNNTPLYDLLTTADNSGIRNYLAIRRQARERFARDPLRSTLQWLIETIDYKRAIEEEVKSEKMRGFKWQNVEELIASVDNGLSLRDFLGTISLDDPREKKRDRGDAVKLMTIHSAKGLEFDTCFLVAMEDQILPHEKSELAEERRLMYVAVTRAKRRLICSMARERMRMGKRIQTRPSRFLFEIPKELRS